MLYLGDSVSPRKATRSLIERGIFTKKKFLEMVRGRSGDEERKNGRRIAPK
jgi:hypothetical protein